MSNNDSHPTEPELPTEFDERIRFAIATVAPPHGLKQAILDQHQVPKTRLLRPVFKLTAIAAALAIGAIVTVTMMAMKGNKQLDNDAGFRVAAASYINDGGFLLDYKHSSLATITAWLSSQSLPAASHIPNELRSTQPIGCKELIWREQTITLVCFHLDDGTIAHLFIGTRNSTTENMFADIQSIQRIHNLETGGWSTDDQVYLLTGSAPSTDIESFLVDLRS